MNIPLGDSEEWYQRYKKLSHEEKNEFLCETVGSPIPDDFFEEDDLSELLISYFEELFRTKEYQKMFTLYESIAGNNPWMMHLRKFFYIDRLFIDWCLFQKETSNLNKYLASFKADPVESIDTLIQVLDKLIFYGQTGYALDISRNVYQRVKDSDKLIMGTEVKFAYVILILKFQDIYKKLKNNQPVDQQVVLDDLAEYDYDITDILDEIIQILGLDYRNIGQYELAELKKNDAFLSNLGLLFCVYMYEEKGVNFSASHEFWDFATVKCFSREAGDKSGECQFDELFRLDERQFNENISGRLGFFSNKRTHGIATAWGMQYLYDFLIVNELISEGIHRQALDAIGRMKSEIIEAYSRVLWCYDFVHSWDRPASCDAAEFETEKDLFAETFAKSFEFAGISLPDSERTQKKQPGYYASVTEGTKTTGPKVGRNAPCPCGSGKKYKKCCGK
jgi:hypothetical protein